MLRNYEFNFTAVSGNCCIEGGIDVSTDFAPSLIIEDVKSHIAEALTNESKYSERGIVFTPDDVVITGFSILVNTEDAFMEIQNHRNAKTFEGIIKAMRNNSLN